MANAVAATAPEVGALLGQKYRVVRQIGRGGMGVVLEAENTVTGAHVAVKLLRDTVADDPDILSRFLREARATARLKSRNIVTIYDVDRDAQGSPYIVMELLEGRDLAAELKARVTVPIDELIGWMIQAATGLACAHDAGIVHRDLKPANIFLTTGPAVVVKIVDFGISKMVTDTTEITMSGDIFGTAHYMSPEQLRDTKSVDARADVWALGVILYRAIEGRMPFDGSPAEVIAGILDEAPVPPLRRPDVPPPVAAAILRALEKDPSRRFASMGELVEALAAFAKRTPQVLEALAALPPLAITRPAPLASAVQAPVPGARSRSGLAALAGAAVLVVVVASAFILWRRSAALDVAAPAAATTTTTSASVASEVPALPASAPAAAPGSSPSASATPRREPSRRTPPPTSSSRPPPNHDPNNASQNPARL